MNDPCNAPGLLPLETAIAQMFSTITPITESQLISIDQALGRVLSSDIVSEINVPPFDNSAMDGYAVCAENQQTQFTLIGTAFAGEPFSGLSNDGLSKDGFSKKASSKDASKQELASTDAQLADGECVRIMTGAKIPKGATAVVMQEKVSVTENLVKIEAPANPQENIRLAGEDIALGATVLAAGRKLKAVDIGLLASLGIAQIEVLRPLKVALFSTGNELKSPGELLNDGDIYESNRPMLKARLQQFGFEVIDLGIIPDDKQKITEAFLSADIHADAVISSGGVSVGDADYTKEVLNDIGSIGFWKIAMKPGKPFAFGQLNSSYFFGLPGNPVSAMVTFEQLVKPALQKLSGAISEQKLLLSAITETAINKRPGRKNFQRGFAWVDDEGVLKVTAHGRQGSGVLSSFTDANCLIVLPQSSGNLEKGEGVTIELF